MVAFQGEGRSMALDSGFELCRRARAVRDELLSVAERQTDSLAFADDGRQALRGRPDLLVEAYALGAELADLDPHLLTALQEPLELSLHLGDRLAEVGKAVLAPLEGFPGLGLTCGECRDPRAQTLLSVAQAHQLGAQALALGGEPGVVRGDQRQAQIALLRLQRLVLLRLLRLALE